eukprot:scaffold32279_cov109-Isochrysis_galbana.AAC.3
MPPQLLSVLPAKVRGDNKTPRRERAVSARPGQRGLKRPQRVARWATIRRTGLMGSFAAPRRPTGSLCGEMLAALASGQRIEGELRAPRFLGRAFHYRAKSSIYGALLEFPYRIRLCCLGRGWAHPKMA